MAQIIDSRGGRPLDPPVLALADPAVQFGAGGFFETIRVESRRPHLMQAHLDRLAGSLRAWKIAWPRAGDGSVGRLWEQGRVLFEEMLRQAMARELELWPPGEAMRLKIIAGPDPLADGGAGGRVGYAWEGWTPGRALVHAAPLNSEYLGPLASRPAMRVLAFQDYRISATHPLSGHKSTQYYLHWEARRRARAAGFDEAILLNTRGELTEGSMSNLFWFREGRLYAPSRDCGGLPGIMAARVARLAALHGLDFNEVRSGPEGLDKAEFVFLTNSLGELIQVSAVGGRKMRSPADHPVGRDIMEWVEADRPARAEGG